jgi:hypothetical protein
MNQILRPKFGQPCSGFNCDEIVPGGRVRELRERAEQRGLRFQTNDILCVGCARRIESIGAASEALFFPR